MIVCICKNVSSTTIDTAIDEGANTLDAVREQTGATECCGKCRFKVNRALQDKQGTTADLSDVACAG